MNFKRDMIQPITNEEPLRIFSSLLLFLPSLARPLERPNDSSELSRISTVSRAYSSMSVNPIDFIELKKDDGEDQFVLMYGGYTNLLSHFLFKGCFSFTYWLVD